LKKKYKKALRALPKIWSPCVRPIEKKKTLTCIAYKVMPPCLVFLK
jgi:hypothetical protein